MNKFTYIHILHTVPNPSVTSALAGRRPSCQSRHRVIAPVSLDSLSFKRGCNQVRKSRTGKASESTRSTAQRTRGRQT